MNIRICKNPHRRSATCILPTFALYCIQLYSWTHTHIYYIDTALGMDSFCYRSTFPNRLWLNSSLESFNFMEEETAREGVMERDRERRKVREKGWQMHGQEERGEKEDGWKTDSSRENETSSSQRVDWRDGWKMRDRGRHSKAGD